MKNAGIALFNFLKTKIEFTSVMNVEIDGTMQTKLFPLIADGSIGLPLAIYGVNEIVSTKQTGEFEFNLSFFFPENQYDECVTFTDTIKEIIDNSDEYNFIASDVEINEENYSYIGILNFKSN
jgi:hypothetical protein